MRFVWLLIFLLTASAAVAQDFSGFSGFGVEDGNLPGSYRKVADPTGQAPTGKVYSFTLDPGPCATLRHTDGHTDCTYGSVRSQLYEKNKKQPPEVWTGWSMYLSADFPIGREQKGQGLYTFAYYHNTECPNVALVSDTSVDTILYLQTNILAKRGDYTCLPDKRVRIADLKSLRGKWHRFELFTKFSAGEDGVAEVWLDGKKAASYTGHTLTVGALPKNFFYFGLYQCCTKGSFSITSATVLYAGLAKGRSRENLNR